VSKYFYKKYCKECGTLTDSWRISKAYYEFLSKSPGVKQECDLICTYPWICERCSPKSYESNTSTNIVPPPIPRPKPPPGVPERRAADDRRASPSTPSATRTAPSRPAPPPPTLTPPPAPRAPQRPNLGQPAPESQPPKVPTALSKKTIMPPPKFKVPPQKEK